MTKIFNKIDFDWQSCIPKCSKVVTFKSAKRKTIKQKFTSRKAIFQNKGKSRHSQINKN